MFSRAAPLRVTPESLTMNAVGHSELIEARLVMKLCSYQIGDAPALVLGHIIIRGTTILCARRCLQRRQADCPMPPRPFLVAWYLARAPV
jgi:hypothetical protein